MSAFIKIRFPSCTLSQFGAQEWFTYRARFSREVPFMVHALFSSKRYRAPFMVFASLVGIISPTYSIYSPGEISEVAKIPRPVLLFPTRRCVLGIVLVRRGMVVV